MAKTLHKTDGAGKLAAHTVGRAAETVTRTAATAGKAAEPVNPASVLQQSVQNLAGTLAQRAVAKVSDRVAGTADRLNEYAEGGGGRNLLAAVTGVEKLAGGATPLQAALSGGMSHLGHTVREKLEAAKESLTQGGGKGGTKKLKLTNIVEHIDVGVPIDLAYDQWTQFADFPKFTKKLEQVEQVSDEKLSWTGKVFWSRRTWESTITEQVPFERIVWRSKGAKGYIDGAVSFHELTPDLTRILVVLVYHPQGVFEKTANIWRAAGRRCRLELKQFQRHVMTEAVLHGEDIVGWHGEIHDNRVVEDDETARRREQEENDEGAPVDEEADEGEEVDGDEEADEEADEDEDEGAEEADEDEEVDDETEEPQPSPRRTVARGKRPVTHSRRVSRGASR